MTEKEKLQENAYSIPKIWVEIGKRHEQLLKDINSHATTLHEKQSEEIRELRGLLFKVAIELGKVSGSSEVIKLTFKEGRAL